MSEFSVKSESSTKLKEAAQIIYKEGFVRFFNKTQDYLVYHLIDKWHFVYLEFSLEQRITSFQINPPMTVKVATFEDLDRIKSEIFPSLKGELNYEKRYFDFLGQEGIMCFLAEKDGKLVHFSWVFLDAFKSPMMDVPFDKSMLKKGDAYIGPIFTNRAARGLVYLQVLSKILLYLKENGYANRVVLFVEGRNSSAVSFYKRLGFREMAHV
jgi:ribosomal protein S18 acetylase RimI-like enzyme